jgi:hypothetical protein
MPTSAIWPLAFFVPGFAAAVAMDAIPEHALAAGVVTILAGGLSFGFAGKLWTDSRLGRSDRSRVAAYCWGLAFVSGATAGVVMMTITPVPHVALLAGGGIIGAIGWVCQSRIEGSGFAATLRGVVLPTLGFSFAFALYLASGYLFNAMAADLVEIHPTRHLPFAVQVLVASGVAAVVASAASGMVVRGSIDGGNRLAGRGGPSAGGGGEEIVQRSDA